MRAVLIASTITLLTSTSVFAADLGQYRAGNPYHSVMSPSADICESHCAGDAQCRSWNYVKVNPQAKGVCEFNQNDAAPIASAISISGSNSGQTYQSGLVAGNTNTIRVGTQIAPQQRPVVQESRGQRRIVREAVPQQRRPQTASTRPVKRPTQPGSLSAQQNQYRGNAAPHSMARPTQRRAPQARSQQQRPQQQQRQLQYPAAHPQFKYDLGGHQMPPEVSVAPRGSQYPQGSNHQTQRSNTGTASGQPYPPQSQAPVQSRGPMAPQPQQQSMMRRPANAPMTYKGSQNLNAPRGQGQAYNGIPPQALARGLTAEQAQRSLFGKLNDDVRVPNSGASVPADPNAPIPTAASRPTQPVQQGPLGELAGGSRR